MLRTTNVGRPKLKIGPASVSCRPRFVTSTINYRVRLGNIVHPAAKQIMRDLLVFGTRLEAVHPGQIDKQYILTLQTRPAEALLDRHSGVVGHFLPQPGQTIEESRLPAVRRPHQRGPSERRSMPLEHVRQRQRNSTARCSSTSDIRQTREPSTAPPSRGARPLPNRRLGTLAGRRRERTGLRRSASWKKPQFHQPPGLRLRQIDAVQTGFLSLAEFSECGGAVACHVPGESGLLETELQRALVSCAPSQVVKRGLLQGDPNLHFSPPNGRSTQYDRQDFVALACRAQRTVKYACARSAARAFPACA